MNDKSLQPQWLSFDLDNFNMDVKLAIVKKNFASPVSNDDIKNCEKEAVPKNTENRNKWAAKLFNNWKTNRESLTEEHDFVECLKEDFTSWNPEQLNFWVPKFLYEIRKKNGDRYPGNTLVSILSGLQALINAAQNVNINFFNSTNKKITNALDTNMKISAKSGVGLHKNSSEVISRQEEETLWEAGQLGSDNPTQLLNTLFYMNGLHFAMRGGDEHRSLQLNQFEIVEKIGELPKLIYKENTSKTFNGGLKHRQLEANVKEHSSNITNPSKCHVQLYKKYLSMRPKNARSDFYLKPLKQISKEGHGYTASAVWGHNKLKNIVSNMCTKAGIIGRKTNHSLKATCATRLFQAGIDEQIIMAKTGHRSTKGVRAYKRMDENQIYAASVIIDNNFIKNSNQQNMTGSITFNINATNVHIHNGSMATTID